MGPSGSGGLNFATARPGSAGSGQFSARQTSKPTSRPTSRPTSAKQAPGVADWSNTEVREWLNTILPGHECLARFSHTTGRVLASVSKEDLRKQARDEEATNVIWAELSRAMTAQRHRDDVNAHGMHAFSIYVRTPADVSMEFDVLPTEIVGKLKDRVARMEGTPIDMQRITWNGVPMLDSRTMASYNVSHGSVLLLVPRLASSAARYAPPPSARSAHAGGSGTSGIPKPRVPIVCTDIARPFPMSIEFPNIPEYQAFMLALQRQTGRRDVTHAPLESNLDSPFLEILPSSNLQEAVQTRVSFDRHAETLLIDTVGDILHEGTRYRVLLHLHRDQKMAYLVTGVRAPER